MNNEMTLDKAVKLSDEELGTVAGGVGLRAPDARTMVRRRTGTWGVSFNPGGVCIKYHLVPLTPRHVLLGAKMKVKYMAVGEDCG